METKKSLLSRGLFEKPFMDSKVTTRSVTRKELILGHVIGPLGLIMLINTIASLLEIYIMRQMSMAVGGDVTGDAYKNLGTIYYWVALGTRLAAMPMGIFTGYLMQHTRSRQGRMRPWYLIFGFVAILTGFLMFLKPVPSSKYSFWIYLYMTYVVYNLLGTSFYYLFNNNIVSLSSRNMVDRSKVAYARKLSWTLISGTLIGMVVNSVLLPYVIQPDETLNSFWILICGLTILAIPLLLIEYFYTRERVMEDVGEMSENPNDIPIREQFKALFHDKYYVLILIATTIGAIADNFRGTNVQYFFVSYVLGGINDPSLFMTYTILTGVPLGVGAIVIYPITKKYGIRNTTLVGYSIVLISSILGLIFPTSVVVAYVAGFLKQLGYIPAAYMLGALTISVFDSVEHGSGYRLEGLMAVGIVGMLQQAIYAPMAGLYEKILTGVGFDANSTGFQPAIAITVLGVAFYGIELVCSAINVCVLPFIDLEKRLPKINADLLERKRQAVLARGEVWVDPEEHERIEKEKMEREAEENRIRDLKDRCARKGLDFDTEYRKYLAKKEAKERKQRGKEAARQAKIADKAKKANKAGSANKS
ncbi:MAG: MFS transporter [Eubacteriales bacterium]|jgi:GPH family glycoside/pentoside/hexuronide:cation symporter